MSISDRSGDIAKLRQLVQLVSTASETIISAWEEGSPGAETIEGVHLPSKPVYESGQTLLAAMGSLEELISDPSWRLMAFACQYFESRALHMAAEHKLADILARGGQDGVPIGAIAQETAVEERKLDRILRSLTSQHIFREVKPGHYANNRISQALVDNEPLRAYIMCYGREIFSSADFLRVAIADPKFGPSYRADETAFQLAVGTTLPRWAWLEERVPVARLARPRGPGYPGVTDTQSLPLGVEADDPGTLVPRPELELFGRGMVGAGRVLCAAHVVDYPWAELGPGTVVDVGGGVGGFGLQLAGLYPELRFVNQDRAPVIEQAKGLWEKENRAAVEEGRAAMQVHDFFEPNPVKGADVYWLRNILHDWSDSYAIKILAGLAASMSAKSRVLIAEHVMNTTLGCEQIASAPAPLPANYGHAVRFTHQHDLTMMAMFNGIERTLEEYKSIAELAGLRLVKVWDCRSLSRIIECRLPVGSAGESA